ncbi:VWA domain-containing protein [Acidobacteria bacterium ACD]|nr:VWA domain-containing protein [Acidobacteria bacterium ACD]
MRPKPAPPRPAPGPAPGPAPAPAPAPTGLVALGLPIPLQGVTVEAEVKDLAVRQVVTQRYRNDEAAPIEAVYVFPLEEGAAVCGFEALIGETHVVGRVEERDAAFTAYDEAMAAGHGAYLLDQEQPDVFTASIGNVPPGAEVLVRLTTVSVVAEEGEDRVYALPTTVSPRYAPEEDRKGVGRTPAEALNPPVLWSVPYGLSLTLRLEMPVGIRSVESPTHPLSVEVDGSRATVTLGERETALDRDLVVRVKLAGPEGQRVLAERDGKGGGAVLVSFRPRFEAATAGSSEVVFLVDRSGSMEGSSIAQVRNALQLFLRSLGEGTSFNVVGFGSTVQALFPESRPYDPQSFAEASRHVEGMRADLGGTEILPALRTVLEARRAEGLPRVVVVLTDGEVTNAPAVLALAARHAGTARVLTLGIGAGASRHLVKGLARAGNGAAEFVAPRERIEGKVMRHLRRALQPAVTDVVLDWGGLAPEQAPHVLPPVFDGERLLVHGLVKELRPATVTLTARAPSGPIRVEIPLDPSGAVEGTTLATLAARELVRDLAEGRSPLHGRKGSRQEDRRGRTEDRVRERLVELGKRYGLVTSATSFVAVEERATPVSGDAVLRKVPVALTHDWGGLEAAAGAGAPAFAAPSAMAMPAAAPAPMRRARGSFMIGEPDHATLADPYDSPLPILHRIDREDARERASTPSRTSTRPLDRLVSLQRHDGSWDLDDRLAALSGFEHDELEKGWRALGPVGGDPRRVFATALALALLERLAPGERDEWELLAQKARCFLESVASSRGQAMRWVDFACALVGGQR